MDKKIDQTSFWLICPNWVEVLRFTKKNLPKDHSFQYMYVDTGIVMGNYGEKPPLMKRRKVMKIDEARDYWQKLVAEGWQPTEPKWI